MITFVYSFFKKRVLKRYGRSFRIVAPATITGGKYIEVGENFSCREGARIDAISEFRGEKFNPRIVIGERFDCGSQCHIGAIHSVTIGNDVLFGSNVYVTDHQHGHCIASECDMTPLDRPLYSRGPVVIEDRVWLGNNVVIMPGVTIGAGSVIGSSAVVTHDIPPCSVAVGVPAKVIKRLV